MKWIEVQVKTTTEAVEAVTNILYEVGVGGLVIEDPNDIIMQDKNESDWDYIDTSLLDQYFEGVIVKGYFEESEDLIDKIELIKQNVEKIPQYNLDKGLGEVTISEVHEKDWSETWRKYYKPKKVGSKVVIKPSWEEYQQQNGDIIIELDPGMAFGTGTHETTIMCIRHLEKYVKKGDTVFDIGCGSGILAITAAKLGASNSIAIDLDEEAVRVTRENTVKNDVEDMVDVRHGNLLDVVETNAHVIVANIIADIILLLASDIPRFLSENGVFIASGIILDKEKEVVEGLKEKGFNIIDVVRMGEWVSVVSEPKEGTKNA